MHSKRALAFIFCTVALDVLALGLMIPVLPTFVLGFMGGDTAGAAEVFGVFATAWGLMQFLCSPLLGALSDRFGRRPVILTERRDHLDHLRGRFQHFTKNLVVLYGGMTAAERRETEERLKTPDTEERRRATSSTAERWWHSSTIR